MQAEVNTNKQITQLAKLEFFISDHQEGHEKQCVYLSLTPLYNKIKSSDISFLIILFIYQDKKNYYRFTYRTLIVIFLFLPLSSVHEIFTGPSFGIKNCFSPLFEAL